MSNIYLRQSTASQEVLLGPFVDSTDGNTAETALTIANTDIKIWKAGATTLANKTSGGATHISGGNYYAVLDATDTDTLGSGAIIVQVAGALAVRVNFTVLPANVYDSLVLGTDLLDINVSQFGNAAGTFASGIPSTALTTNAINAVADQVWDEAASGHVTAGSFGAGAYIIRSGTAQAGASTTITLDAGASASDDFYNNQFLAIVSGTGAGQGRIITDYVGATKVATVASWITNPDATSVFVIRPFGSIPGATAPTASEVADAVWDEALSGHTTSGSAGQALGGPILHTSTAQAGAASTITLAAGASATNDLYKYSTVSIIGGTGAGQSRQISGYVGSSKIATVGVAWTTNPSSDSVYIVTPLGVDAATVAAIADAVWDEARSGHVAAGTFGEYVLADATRISGDATAADNCESFFDGTGYAGTNNVIPTVTAVSGNVGGNVVGSVGSVTGNVGGNVVGSVGSVTGNVGGNVTGTVASVVGNVGGNVTGSVGSLATQAKADVNAEVVDALNVDTYAEPGQGAPGVNVSLVAKIGYLYKAWRNRQTQTASQYTLYADNATTVDQKATVSDNGTIFDRNEVASGP